MAAPDLQRFLAPFLREAPEGVLAVAGEGVAQLAAEKGLHVREAMCECLAANIWPLRFVRNAGTLTAQDQVALLFSRVVVLGCGGLGGYSASLLARLGVGALTLCDGDVFDESNLNRQMFCTEGSIGKNKAQVAAKGVGTEASHVDVRVFDTYADAGNVADVCRNAHVVLDGLDSAAARLMAATHVLDAGIPYVYGSLAGNEGFAMALTPGNETSRVALNALCGPGAEKGAERLLGTPATTPAVVASLQAGLTLGLITGKECHPLLHHIDVSACSMDSFSFS